jgi:amidase
MGERVAIPDNTGVAAPWSDLSSYDAVGLAELIRSRQITPAELIEDTIGKIEAINPKLNAVIYKTYERAFERASAPLGDGPLAGIPILVKDNATIAGIRLTRGSRALRDYVPNQTAPFFVATENAGLILVGVTNMPEMGLIDGTENVLYGPTRNPWNLDYSPGGSSGGSAACVAAGILPLAHGTDGGGSIRIPASHCGLFGLKASRGRLLPGRFAAPSWDRLVDGCITRTVRDTAMCLRICEDPGTRLSKADAVFGNSATRLKIAVSYEGMHGQMPHPEVRSAVLSAALLCAKLGHVVEETKLPLEQAVISDAARQVAAVEVAREVNAIARARGFMRLEHRFESRALGLREEAMCKGPFEQQIHAAIPILKGATIALDQFFQKWDILLTPVLRTPIFKTGKRDQTKFGFEELDAMLQDYVAYTSLHNICGTTAMSVPLHWDADGLPIGVQFAARAGAEATLLTFAYELEAVRPWTHRRPSFWSGQPHAG